jgi:hypothetical protein
VGEGASPSEAGEGSVSADEDLDERGRIADRSPSSDADTVRITFFHKGRRK